MLPIHRCRYCYGISKCFISNNTVHYYTNCFLHIQNKLFLCVTRTGILHMCIVSYGTLTSIFSCIDYFSIFIIDFLT